MTTKVVINADISLTMRNDLTNVVSRHGSGDACLSKNYE